MARPAIGNPSLPCSLSSRPTIPTSPRPSGWTATRPAALTLRANVPDIPRVVEKARRELAGYYAMIENLDWNVGRIRAALEQAGLAHNTHIIFFSDHGDMHGSHGQFRKTNPWEESIRVPFIIGGHVPQYANQGGRLPVPDQPCGHRPDHAGSLRHRRAGLDGGNGLLRAALY